MAFGINYVQLTRLQSLDFKELWIVFAAGARIVRKIYEHLDELKGLRSAAFPSRKARRVFRRDTKQARRKMNSSSPPRNRERCTGHGLAAVGGDDGSQANA
jgi:hypothetical protein